MTDEDKKKFGDAIAARWQQTGLPALQRAWELCKHHDLDIVVLGMDRLKKKMNPEYAMVDPDWLKSNVDECAGIKKENEEGKAANARTAKYLNEQKQWEKDCLDLRAVLDGMHLVGADAQRAFDACAAKYDAAWTGFGATQKARLMKAYLQNGFPH
jgi:hypothetical protein